MTAPLPAGPGAAARLAVVAGWDVPGVRGGLAALGELDDGFPAWRARLDVVARTLEEGRDWSGPAATQARELLLQLSSAAASLDAGFSGSRADCARLLRAAITATDRATTALALARELPVPLDAALDDAGTLSAAVDRLVLGPAAVAPAVTAAQEALAAAEAVQAAAGRAAGELPALVALPGGSIGPVGPPPALPAAGSPALVARWWAALPLADQLSLIASEPGRVGAMDGVPAWARDRANRIALGEVLADPAAGDGVRAAARVVDELLAGEERAGRSAQLHLLDLAGDRVAVAFGDVDTADAVALVVPGMATSPADDLAAVSGDARDLARAAREAEPGVAVATVAWLGYRAPQFLSAAARGAATRGGALLDRALGGLAAARAATGAPPARTTVVAHSYGTVVVDEAADRPGRLAADALVLLGSPGMEETAADLEAAEVFDAASPADPVSWVGWFGTETWSRAFGSTGLPADAGTGHSGWFDPDRPTLAAVGEVVVGTRPG
ncbi:hypothetical protein JKP75_01660 [Blastococcus sp. TML/M2B]|uniref:alpha/beta hydrolase n=1 Tax=unclassified Blastococcus TaxID=2619396 RepID=UPI00190B1360|nr:MULTISPECIES: alpha/beta hydrolase [unclassified Blastococcus]MBN1091407.1 hypothetical protein [Blastococcus sp. TML/M2B]MBN1095036.1 hypothetical protein [Blastococcus sp. TML/C7B]